MLSFRIHCTHVLLVIGLLAGCTENKSQTVTTGAAAVTRVSVNMDSLRFSALKDSVRRLALDTNFKYHPVISKGRVSIERLEKKYGSGVLSIMKALNRVDEKHFRYGDTLVVPSKFLPLISYSPFPFVVEKLKDVPKMIFVSRKLQAFAAYERGVIVRWGPTSTGRKKKPTPEGLFFMNWKAKKTVSTIDPEWILPYYFNFHSREGVALHEYDMPGYPASHACVRLLNEDARWFYRWAEQWLLAPDGQTLEAQGTPIIVFDEYPFGKRKPWRKKLDSSGAARVSEERIDELLAQYLPDILRETALRLQVLEARKNPPALQVQEQKITTPSPVQNP